MKIVTHWSTLIFYASEMGKAEARGDLTAYEKWKRKYDDYAAVCAQADEMML